MGMLKIGGDTYNNRDIIKSAGGRWDATSKTWSVADSVWAGLLQQKPIALRRCMIVGGVSDLPVGSYSAKPAADRPIRLRPVGPCRKCHSYCYGDCEA